MSFRPDTSKIPTYLRTALKQDDRFAQSVVRAYRKQLRKSQENPLEARVMFPGRTPDDAVRLDALRSTVLDVIWSIEMRLARFIGRNHLAPPNSPPEVEYQATEIIRAFLASEGYQTPAGS